MILNLFSLMLDAGVPDIALEPDKTVQKVNNLYINIVRQPAYHGSDYTHGNIVRLI